MRSIIYVQILVTIKSNKYGTIAILDKDDRYKHMIAEWCGGSKCSSPYK